MTGVVVWSGGVWSRGAWSGGRRVSGATRPARTATLPTDPIRQAALAGVAGALCIAFSAILVKLADVSPSTAAVYRCVYALPWLAVLAAWEHRRFGPRAPRERRFAVAAGLLLRRRPDLLAPRDRGRRRRAGAPCSATSRS